jgi:hypothetical protein
VRLDRIRLFIHKLDTGFKRDLNSASLTPFPDLYVSLHALLAHCVTVIPRERIARIFGLTIASVTAQIIRCERGR